MTVLSIIGKCVSQGHYNSVIRHSTSLQWIYDMLRSDYDIQKKGIHFFNIMELKYDSTKMTPISFYNQYRTLVSNNLGRKNDKVKYKNLVLGEDEKMTAMLEDIILLDSITEIDPRLPAYIKNHYTHKMEKSDKLMDFKSDIMVNVPVFLELMEKDVDPTLNAFRQGNRKPFFPKKNFRNDNKNVDNRNGKKYCRLCFKSDLPRAIFTSHNIGDPRCTELSYQDKQRMGATSKMSNIQNNDKAEDEDDDIATQFCYDGPIIQYDDEEEIQVRVVESTDSEMKNLNSYRSNEPKLGYIKHEPTKILTVFQDAINKSPLHIDVDSGASLNNTE